MTGGIISSCSENSWVIKETSRVSMQLPELSFPGTVAPHAFVMFDLVWSTVRLEYLYRKSVKTENLLASENILILLSQ